MVDFQLDALEAQQARLNQIAEGLTGPVAVVLEGRDTAGKSSTIRALTHYLPPKYFSVVSSAKRRVSKSFSLIARGTLALWFKKLTAGALICNITILWKPSKNGKLTRACTL